MNYRDTKVGELNPALNTSQVLSPTTLLLVRFLMHLALRIALMTWTSQS